MEETQRQEEILQSDLETRRNGYTVSIESAGNFDSEVERLRHQINQASRRIGELETERQEELPPDYYSSAFGH